MTPCIILVSRGQINIASSLVATQTVDKAAIFNKEGTSVWASTPHFDVSIQTHSGTRARPDGSRQIGSDEISAIVKNYNEKPKDDAPRAIFGTGFKLNREKYVTIRADERSLYGKKVWP